MVSVQCLPRRVSATGAVLFLIESTKIAKLSTTCESWDQTLGLSVQAHHSTTFNVPVRFLNIKEAHYKRIKYSDALMRVNEMKCLK